VGHPSGSPGTDAPMEFVKAWEVLFGMETADKPMMGHSQGQALIRSRVFKIW
jgi:hypothetical protein